MCGSVLKSSCGAVARVPIALSHPEKFVSVMTTAQFEKSICEVCEEFCEQDKWGLSDFATDDLHGTDLPMEQVLAARHQEMSHMKGHTLK